jgi:hypothetical protein
MCRHLFRIFCAFREQLLCVSLCLRAFVVQKEIREEQVSDILADVQTPVLQKSCIFRSFPVFWTGEKDWPIFYPSPGNELAG